MPRVDINDDELRRAALLLVRHRAVNANSWELERIFGVATSVGCTVAEIAEEAGVPQQTVKRVLQRCPPSVPNP